MAATVIGRRYGTQYSEQMSSSFVVTGTWTVIYTIQVDDECADEAYVLSADGIPQLNQQSDKYPGLRVTSRSASEIGYKLWEAVINYSTPEILSSGGSGGGGLGPGSPGGEDFDPTEEDDKTQDPRDLKPWERRSTASFSTRQKKYLMAYAPYFGTNSSPTDFPTLFPWHDGTLNKYSDIAFGRLIPYQPVTNSAGEPIYYDTVRLVYSVTLTKAVKATDFDFAAYIINAGTVSINPVQLLGRQWPAFCVYIEAFNADKDTYVDPETAEQIDYYNVSYTYAIDPYGHIEDFADIGSIYFSGNRSQSSTLADAVVFRNEENEIITGPLNGLGGKSATASPTYLRYCPYPIANW